MFVAHAVPTRGVGISRVTEPDSHPLDRHVAGVRRRDEEAFAAVYNAVVDDLVSFAFGMVSDRQTAEDIVQQAFVELVKAAPKLKGSGSALRAWLFRATRFGCLDEYRRRSRRPEAPQETIPEPAFEPNYLENHLDPELERALSALTRRHRTLVLLRHVGGLGGDEIATVMKTTRRAAYSALARAESNLRLTLEASRDI